MTSLNYTLPIETQEFLRAHVRQLVIISGPSAGAGKGKVIDMLKSTSQLPIWQSMSMTTRQKRPTERHKHQYDFVPMEKFVALEQQNGFLEANGVTEGNRYGTPLQPVLDHLAAGDVALLEIEVHGAKAVNALIPDALYVFIKPTDGSLDDDLAELRRRIIERGTETPESIERRLDQAKAELEFAKEFGFYTWVVNATGLAEAAVQQIDDLIHERLKPAA